MGMFEHPGAWLAIVGLGCYHGINPGMGWLFAVSNGMQERRGSAVFAALPPDRRGARAGHVGGAPPIRPR